MYIPNVYLIVIHPAKLSSSTYNNIEYVSLMDNDLHVAPVNDV